MGYQKFCYWVDIHTFGRVKAELNGKGIQITDEVYIPCRVLKKSIEIGCVRPQAWEGFCRRRTSWFLGSEKAGKLLVVSNQPLDLSGLGNPILITESTFNPARLPASEEIAELVQSESFQRRKPQVWDKIEPIEKDVQQRWFERYGATEPYDFAKILVGHSANHANFLEPNFFTTVNGVKAPYSIADSIHVCSSCLEVFNILGEQWPLKYVVPCIGAVQFSRLPQDHYFRVETR